MCNRRHSQVFSVGVFRRGSLDIALREINNCWAFHDAACDDLAGAGTKTIDLKRKAHDAHDRTRSHRERFRRATKEL